MKVKDIKRIEMELKVTGRSGSSNTYLHDDPRRTLITNISRGHHNQIMRFVLAARKLGFDYEIQDKATDIHNKVINCLVAFYLKGPHLGQEGNVINLAIKLNDCNELSG